jgi:hypothetical protein
MCSLIAHIIDFFQVSLIFILTVYVSLQHVYTPIPGYGTIVISNHRQTDKQTDRQTVRQTDRRSDRQTNRQQRIRDRECVT